MSVEHDENNPYVGPRPFERNEQDSARFFGRAQEAQEILSLIFGHPLVLVYAQSGSGKTSLFNASVVPALENNGFDVLPLTRVWGTFPAGIDIEEIKNSYIFNALLNMDREAAPQSLVAEPLTTFLASRPRATDAEGQPIPRVIIFDQFEELFSFNPEDWQDQRNNFFHQVTEALEADPLLRIVFIIREDFLAQLDPYARRLPERLRSRYRLERLREEAALQAIKGPIASTNRSYEAGVAESLVKELLSMRTVDASGEMAEIPGQYVEPVQLQVVCLTLWSSLPPDCTVITPDHLKGFDVNLALSDFYKSAIEAAATETGVEEAVLRNWFGKTLITPMQTRSTVYRGDEATGGIPNTAVDVLEGRHLIRAEFRAGVRWYELTHDRFIEAILTSNKEWFASRRKVLANPLAEAARDWERLGKDEGSLLRGALLEEGNAWAQNHPNEMDNLERAFLKASQVHYQQELESNARIGRTFRTLTIGLAVVVLIAALAAFTAFRERDSATIARSTAEMAATKSKSAAVTASAAEAQAESSANIAQVEAEKARSGQLALQSIASLKNDPQLSLLLAIEAMNEQQTVEADDALRQALEASRTKAILSHTNRVNALAFSADGTTIATGDASGIVELWDVTTGSLLTPLEEHADSIVAIAFSPDNKLIATASADGTALLWDASNYYLVERLQSHESQITAVAFSPDGKYLVTADAEGIAIVWSVGSPDPLAILKGHTAQVNAVAISPAGDRIATASFDGTARLWDADGVELAILAGHSSSINAVVFSPDGQLLATASSDGTARLWEPTGGTELAVLSGHDDTIVNLAFSDHGDLLATASVDTTVKLWDVATAIDTGGRDAEVATLIGHKDRVNAVAFRSDGQLLASASADGTARLWNVPGGELQAVLSGHTSSVNVVTFSPDGELLATASSDSTARIWNVTGGEAQRSLYGHEAAVTDVAFNPDGSVLASRGEDSAILWDFATLVSEESGGAGAVVSGFDGYGFGLDFSPDGNLLALSGQDTEGEKSSGTVTLLDASILPDKKIIHSQSFPGKSVQNLAFSPDGSLLAIISAKFSLRSSTVQLWQISDGLQREVNFQQILYGLSFSPDSTLLVTSGSDFALGTGTVHLLDVSALINGNIDSEVAIIRSQQPLNRTIFSPDGRILASGSSDGTIRLWNVANIMSTGGMDAEIAILHGHEQGVIGLAFSSDGRWLASTGEDGTVRIWNIPSALESEGNDAEVYVLRGHAGTINDVAFSSDGRWLVTGGEDGTVRLWTINPEDLVTLACQRATRNFTKSEWESYFGQDVDYRPTCKDVPYHSSVLESMIEQGKVFARQGEIDKALAIWHEVGKLDPEMELDQNAMLADALIELARQDAFEGNYDSALDSLRKGAELDPTLELKPEATLAGILVEVGRQYASEGNYARLLEILRRAVELDPTLKIVPEAEVALVQVREYIIANDYDQALASLRHAIELDPALDVKLRSGRTVSGVIEAGSEDVLTFEGISGQTVTIEMKSDNSELDTYLILMSPNGDIRYDDDGGSGYNSQLVYSLEATGTYLILARGFSSSSGAYTLSLLAP